VLPVGGITDRSRRLVVDGVPVATGVLAVGDAMACTNPVGGRGISLGLMHAVGTAEVVQQHLDDPVALARAQHAMTQSRLMPWYRSTVEFDRQRMAQIQAAIQGRPPLPPTGPGEALPIAMMYDASLFRAALEITSVLALPSEIFPQRGVVERILELADIHPALTPPGPSRDELLVEHRAARRSHSSRARELLRRLSDWALTLEGDRLVKVWTYHGKKNMLTLLPRLVDEGAGLVTIYNDNGRGYLQFWSTVFDRRAPNALAKINEAIAPAIVGRGNTIRDIPDNLLELLTRAYREAASPSVAAVRA
jgi:hypothetical protein